MPGSIPSIPDVAAMLLADKRSPQTRRAYEGDLRQFFGRAWFKAAWGARPQAQMIEAFLRLSPHQIAAQLAVYKSEMIAAQLAEATINRRLSAIKSLLTFAYRLGYSQTDGSGLIDGERVQAYRDTRGIPVAALKRLVDAPNQKTLAGKRDHALLRLLAENGLRRAEVCALSVTDFSFSSKTLQILGKGHGSQKEPITLAPRCADAIAVYLLAAGHGSDQAAPLFLSLHHGCAGLRLTVDGLRHLIALYGRAVGIPDLTPHKLRHSCITAALDATDGNVRRVQKLSRHAKIETLLKYDDNRRDEQGALSRMLSDLL